VEISADQAAEEIVAYVLSHANGTAVAPDT
jgi:hypothetical protein